MRARPVLKAGAWEVSTKPRAQGRRSRVSGGIILLNDSEDVQGKPAAQGDLELVAFFFFKKKKTTDVDSVLLNMPTSKVGSSICTVITILV